MSQRVWETPEYQAWANMKQRCFNPNTRSYPRYGGRGITVCEAWSRSFEEFFLAVGPRPTPAHSLDRVDNNGNYEPGNIRWATKQEQTRNREKTLSVRIDGKRLFLADLEHTTGRSAATLRKRLKTGKSPEQVAQRERVIPQRLTVDVNGTLMTYKQLEAKTGIPASNLHARLTRMGWPLEKALSTPNNAHRKTQRA